MLPPPSAGPNQVRAYLAEILVSKHDATPDHARQIASLWQLGRSYDLRREGMSYFSKVFGTDVGRFLFRTVQQDIRDEWSSSLAGILNYWTTILSIILFIFFLFRAYRGNSAQGMLASVRYALVAFGPPMVICGIQDEFSEYQAGRIIFGGLACVFAGVWYLTLFLDRLNEKENTKVKQ